MLALSLSLALLAPQGPNAPVVINEFSYDDTSTDDREFVELYNATAAAIDISGWKLDSNDPSGANAAYTIPAATILGPGAFYVLGQAIVPNVNQVVVGWENDNESLILRDATGAIVDALSYEVNKGTWLAMVREGEGVWGNEVSTDGPEQTSKGRIRDGQDTGNNGYDFCFMPQTPGASNNMVAAAYADNFDATASETAVAGWRGSFRTGRAIDPTVVSASNPNAIVASPQGGNAAIFWDITGGGDANMLMRDQSGDVVFEAWAYFTSISPTGATEFEEWSVGLGTTDSFYNFTGTNGTIAGATANGNTGVSWTYLVAPTGNVLYCIDHNDGGEGALAISGPTVLGSIPIVAGVNDGWRRIRLERFGNQVLASFGNTPGCADGTTFQTTIAYTGPATIYAGYREILANNANTRPVTLDDISVRASTSSVGHLGSAVATTVGTPAIDAIGPPAVGNANWKITLAGLVPAQSTILIVGVALLGTPLDVAATFGGQPGSYLYVAPAFVIYVPSGSGSVTLAAPIPCDGTLLGVPVYYQDFDFDANLGYALPLGNSDVLTTVLGN